MELSIDTSTSEASIALSEKGTVRADLSWRTARNHTRELIPNILRLLGGQGIRPADLRALAVAIGPGSFNGLRVGIATAKGLAFALCLPLVGVGTLELIARPCAVYGLPVCAILPMGPVEVAAAVFIPQGERFTKAMEEHLTSIAHLCARIPGKTVFCGDIRPEDRTLVREMLGPAAVFPEASPVRSRAAYLAEIAWCRIEMGQSDDPEAIHPLYLRKPSITKPDRRKTHALSDMWEGSQG